MALKLGWVYVLTPSHTVRGTTLLCQGSSRDGTPR